MRVAYFHRRPNPARNYSLEGYFKSVRAYLPDTIQPTIVEASWPSKGVLPRVRNIAEARRRQADVNHITGDIHYVAYALESRRTVLTIADCRFETMEPGVRRQLLKWLWYDLPVARSAIVTVLSEFTKERLLSHVRCAPSKVRVVPVCISPEFVNSPKPFNHERPVLLQIGTAWNKNLARLCAALRGIKCHLRIIGPLSSAQRDLLREHDIEYSVGMDLSQQQIVQEYVNCDVVAFVSLYEGFGMPIVEGNCTGRPVITSDIASMPDVARDAACIVDPLDIDSIRSGLLRIMNEDGYRETLIQNGLRNSRRFLPTVVAQEFVAIYDEIASMT